MIRLKPLTVLAAIVAIILTAACRTAPNPAVGGDYFTDIASINDIQMYYEVHGDGPPLILLHGGLGNASHWKNQIPVLAGHYKVIAPDGRGQGRSSLTDRKISYELMAADVLALMDHLEIDRAHILGWSDGGNIGLHLAIHHPDRVNRVIVYGANYDPSGVRPDAGGNKKILDVIEKAEQDYQALSPNPARWAALLENLSGMWASEPNFTREDLARVRVPLLVLDGDADEAIDTEHTRQMAEWIPTAELTLIPGTGHFAMWEKPDETNNVLLEFLSRMSDPALTDFATRYAAAWSSQDPVSLTSFYAEDGSLIVNGGEPSTGRAAIAATARSFMEAFPDIVVMLERVEGDAGHATFHWRWTGTNTGPGGTGNAVDLTGYEEWTLDDDGLILESNGHYDAAEYERQVNGETGFGDA